MTNPYTHIPTKDLRHLRWNLLHLPRTPEITEILDHIESALAHKKQFPDQTNPELDQLRQEAAKGVPERREYWNEATRSFQPR